MSTLQVGISGCDATTLRTLAAVAAHADCAIAALHDDDAAALANAQAIARAGVATTDFAKFLQSGVDFVVLGGPLAQRAERLHAANEQAVPCLLRAPMANDLAAARALAADSDAHGQRLAVAVPGHDDPLFDQIRRMVAEDWLGGLVAVQAIAGDDALLRPPHRPRLHPAYERLAPLLHQLTWLCGRELVAVTAQGVASYGADVDHVATTAQLRGGALLTLHGSHTTRANAIAIHGTDGGVRIAGDRIWLCGKRPFRGRVFAYEQAGEELVLARAELQPAIDAAAAQLEPLGRFARWLDDRDDFPCPAEQALADLQAIDAIVRALHSGGCERV